MGLCRDPAPEASASGAREEHEPATSPGQPPRQFKAVVDKWMRDTSRIDADQLRLRVLCDDDYFQFFTVIVPGTDLRTSIHGASADGVTLPQMHRAIGELAVEQVRQKIIDGDAPRSDDPTIAIELFPDVGQAVRRASSQSDEDHTPGETIETWTQ